MRECYNVNMRVIRENERRDLMKKVVFVVSAAAVCTLASTAFAADMQIEKFTHTNVVGDQTCYSGEDLEEKNVTEVPDVYFGMRINKPVFKAYLKADSAAEGSRTIKIEQYSEKDKLLSSEEQTVDLTGAEEYVVEFSHRRNTEYIKLYENGEYIGGLDDNKQDEELILTEYPDDYEIYQRGSDNTAVVTFAGTAEAAPAASQVEVLEDGTVYAGVEDCMLYAAKYSGSNITGLEAVPVIGGKAKLTDPELGMKLMFWDDEMTPLINACTVTGFLGDENTVTLTVAGEEYKTAIDEKGYFRFDIELEPGIYDAVLNCNGVKREFTDFGVGDIWVAAGQSNMTDMGAITSGFDYETQDPIPENVHIIYPEDVTWQKMTHPAGEGRFFKSGIRTSPVTSFARILNESLGVPIGIVQSSVGGTNIYQWAEGIKPGDDNDGYLINALKACFDNKSSKDIKGIIWYQGCNDTMNENYAYNYEKLCETIFGQFREFFGDNTPIITTQINDANQDSTASLGYYDAWSYVKDVQRRYPETHENVYVTGTGAYDLGDTIHNSAASNLLVGEDWAKMALNKVYGKTEIVCEHPTIDKIEVSSDNTLTLTFKNVGSEGLYLREDIKYLSITNGITPIQLGDLKSEFTVRMGGDKILTSSNKGKGTEVDIVSAELVDENTVVLTTAEELNGNIAVDCCYGKRFAPTLTDKASGRSVLAFYNVMAEYPGSIEIEPAMEFIAADTAHIRENEAASAEKMYLNHYSGSKAYAVMKFDMSAAEKDRDHIQTAKLGVYTSSIDKDRTGNIEISEISSDWSSSSAYADFTYSPLKAVYSAKTNTASLFPVGSYSDIDITDYIKTAPDMFSLGISVDYAAVCDMDGVKSDNPPKLIVQYGNIVKLKAENADGEPVSGIEMFIEGLRSTQYEKRSFVTDESGSISVVLTAGEYRITTEQGEYIAVNEEFNVGETDMDKTITLAKNNQILTRVEISGGETEVRETQGEKTLEPFTAKAYDADGAEISGAVWEWSITPEIMAVVENGAVTINSHATAGSVLKLTAQAEFNGEKVSDTVEITITEAGDITYGFTEYSEAKSFAVSDVSDVLIGNDGIKGSAVSGGNYSNIAVISSADKSQTGYYPYGSGFVTDGYYLFLGAGGNSSTVVFTLTLPETASSGKYINIKYAKPQSTNNGTHNRTDSAPDSEKTISVGNTVIDVQSECEYDKWYTSSVQLESGTDTLTIRLGKWAGLAIDHISVTSEPESSEIIIPDTDESVKVMCLGDSITEGFTVAGAYRNRLCALIEADGMDTVIDFIGDRSNGTGYDKDHAGHSGYAIADIPADEDCEGKGRNGITDEIDSYVGTNTPDLVLLQIGTNDILSLYRLDESKARLETLIEKVKTKLSEDGRIYLATIPYIAENATYNKTGKTQEELDSLIDTFNNGVREIAEADETVYLVDMNASIELSDLKDGIHPTESGYTKMGDVWYSVIKERLVELISKLG